MAEIEANNNHGVFRGSITAEVRVIAERVREHAQTLAKVREDVIILKVESRMQARIVGFVSGGASAGAVLIVKWLMDMACK